MGFVCLFLYVYGCLNVYCIMIWMIIWYIYVMNGFQGISVGDCLIVYGCIDLVERLCVYMGVNRMLFEVSYIW